MPKRPAPEPVLQWKLWLHPHAPAQIGPQRPHHVPWTYRQGLDPSLWQAVAEVRLSPRDHRVIGGDKLHHHGMLGEPSKQFTGWSAPYRFYADFSRRCARCGHEFVFSAGAQRFWYEEVGAHVDAVAVRCGPCRRELRERNQAGPAWDRAQQAWQDAPTVTHAYALAEAGVALVQSGAGRGRFLERLVGLLRQAVTAHPAEAELEGWLARVELLRGPDRIAAAETHAEAFFARTRQRRTKRAKAVRSALEQELQWAREARSGS